MTNIGNNDVSKSFFCVLNNPAEHGYAGTPEEVCIKLRNEWITGSKTRTGAWAFCISAQGLHHVHMVLEDKKAMRFNAVKASYPTAHIEITRGTKADAEAYITKQPPYDEKGETVVCIIRHGEIQGRQGKRSDLEDISELLDAGMTPTEIFRTNITYRRYERLIRSAYFDKRLQETPTMRDVTVHYIVGDSGTGKSYTYITLCEKHGEDHIYHTSDYLNGGLDRYESEPILFMDEYKGQLPYGQFLTICDKYKTQYHARYSNIYTLWDEVYITSIYPPEAIYRLMVPYERRGTDTYEQLRRRITDITYCYKDVDGEYRRFTIPMSEYADYAELRAMALESLADTNL